MTVPFDRRTWIAWGTVLCLVGGLLACDPAARAAGPEPTVSPTRVAVVLVNGQPAPRPGAEPDGQTTSGCFCFDK
ncbi:MAG: hypothetical protein FJ033_02140 [Chloroflexi bacterium]|nr:hypothetical protein [Chloroflexota bacterium]